MYQYDPRNIVCTWGPHIVDGFSDGEFISAEMSADAVSMHNGATGAVTAIVSANESGEVTVTLSQTSPSNDFLSAAAAAQRRKGNGIVKYPLQIKDLGGTTLFLSEEAMIKKEPKTGFGEEHTPREWVFLCAKMKPIIGGSLR